MGQWLHESRSSPRIDYAAGGLIIFLGILGGVSYFSYQQGKVAYFDAMQSARQELKAVREQLAEAHSREFSAATQPKVATLEERLVNSDALTAEEAELIQGRELWVRIGRKEYMAML